MGESHENLLKVVRHCQDSLDKYTENRNDNKLLHYLQKLYKLPIKVIHLEQTGVGRTVNGLRKLGGVVGDSAKSLVAKWKEMVVGEQEAEEDDDDDDDDDDEEDEDEDDEDGYQTGEDQSNESDEKNTQEEKIKHSSSHRKSENEKDKKSKDRHNLNEKHHKHEKEKSHKRKNDSSSSDDERSKKRQKKNEEKYHKKKYDTDSEEESKKKKKHKSESKSKKSSESSSEDRKRHKESSSKDKSKTNRRDEGNSSKTKDDKKNREKDRKDRKDEKKIKTSKNKTINGDISYNGIDSGSGASFAEALGMCEPSSSKSNTKKKSSDKKEKVEVVPKLFKESISDQILDVNISSLLPPITPNYRPLGFIPTDQPKKLMSESEALTSIITSKNQRTKVYSGNKCAYGKVPSLFELCIRVLQDNIDALEYTGGVPYNVLKPILEKATPNQLYAMEHHNPYLIEDTDELWQLHCQKEFRNKQREEMETWREMYLRCLDERDAKLKALTANIKQAQDKSLPVRTTKLAYVDAVAKPPRNIARKQAKNGTAFDIRKPSMTPSSKLTSLATAGEAGKVAVPNPGSRAAERSSGHAPKPKKAPLMLKSISSFKNRFKR